MVGAGSNGTAWAPRAFAFCGRCRGRVLLVPAKRAPQLEHRCCPICFAALRPCSSGEARVVLARRWGCPFPVRTYVFPLLGRAISKATAARRRQLTLDLPETP